MSLPTLALLSLLAAAPRVPALETVAELPERPGAIALVGSRLFLALHPLGHPETKLVELGPGGRRAPYPSGVLARGFGAVTALASDGAGGLWILDAGAEGRPATLTGWNTEDERRIRSVRLPAAAVAANSWLCALAVDRAHQVAYVADRSRADWTGDSHPALLVVSLESGATRRLLEDHPALEPDAVPITVDRRPVAHREADGSEERIQLGVSQLSLDPSGTWLYLAALNGGRVWRVRTADLVDASRAPDELAARLEPYARRPSGNGIVAEDGGRVVVTDVEGHALRVTAPSGTTILVEDPRLQWPDGLARWPDEWIYVTVNQLDLHPALNRGREESRPPYRVLRIRMQREPPPRDVRPAPPPVENPTESPPE
ncbi:MAG: L-dopachrome tautomerase-related protein [Myxococcaceae bacterium]